MLPGKKYIVNRTEAGKEEPGRVNPSKTGKRCL